MFPWWHAYQRQACANSAAWANSSAPVQPPPRLWASRSPYAGHQWNTLLQSVSEHTKATLAGLYLSWTYAKHRPWKISEGAREKGVSRVVGRLTHPRQKKCWHQIWPVPKRQSKTSRQAMKSSEHLSLQRHRLPTVIYCTTSGKHTHWLIMWQQNQTGTGNAANQCFRAVLGLTCEKLTGASCQLIALCETFPGSGHHSSVSKETYWSGLSQIKTATESELKQNRADYPNKHGLVLGCFIVYLNQSVLVVLSFWLLVSDIAFVATKSDSLKP